MTVREENELKKEYLNKYKKLGYKIKSLEDQEASIQAEINAVRAIEYSDMPGASRTADLSDYMVKLEQIAERISEAKRDRLVVRGEIESRVLDIQDGKESDILRRRYILGESWDDIAKEMHYTWRHTLRLHGKALHNFKID